MTSSENTLTPNRSPAGVSWKLMRAPLLFHAVTAATALSWAVDMVLIGSSAGRKG